MNTQKEHIPRKDIRKWLHIALDMMTTQMKKDIETISVLNHQIKEFDNMHKIYQDEVIRDFNKLMDELEPNYIEVMND